MKSTTYNIWSINKTVVPLYSKLTTMDKKIVKCRITEQPTDFFDEMPKVMVILDGEEKEELLFVYYPDELTFVESEFIGKTIKQGRQLKYQKDMDFLRS